MNRAVRTAVAWIIAGGFAFWLPVTIVALISGQRAGAVVLNLAAAVGLAALWLLSREFAFKPRWAWALAGIYILGPGFMLPSGIPSLLTGNAGPGGWWLALFILLPPMTLWLALLNGTIFSVIGATIALPILAGRHQRRPVTTPPDREQI